MQSQKQRRQYHLVPPPASISVPSDGNTRLAGRMAVCHEGRIPDFAEAELERLYGHVFSSLAYFRIYGGIDQASTYIATDRGRISSLFLYRRQGAQVWVINEGILIDDDAANRFAEHMFRSFPEVNVVRFNAVETNVRQRRYPHQLYNCTDDTMVVLPSNAEAYLDQLGKSTRKNVKRYMRRLRESFPDFHYQVYETQDIDESDLRAIIDLNRIRMENKNKRSGLDDEMSENAIRLARTHGTVGVARIGGKVCAGTITFRFGDNYYSLVRAHDPKYDDYRLGLLGGVLIISECIARGGREFHFLWGRESHKLLFNGVQKDLNHLALYRSRTHLLRHADVVLENLRRAQMRRFRLWAHGERENNTRLWRTARTMTHAWRRVRKTGEAMAPAS